MQGRPGAASMASPLTRLPRSAASWAGCRSRKGASSSATTVPPRDWMYRPICSTGRVAAQLIAAQACSAGGSCQDTHQHACASRLPRTACQRLRSKPSFGSPSPNTKLKMASRKFMPPCRCSCSMRCRRLRYQNGSLRGGAGWRCEGSGQGQGRVRAPRACHGPAPPHAGVPCAMHHLAPCPLSPLQQQAQRSAAGTARLTSTKGGLSGRSTRAGRRRSRRRRPGAGRRDRCPRWRLRRWPHTQRRRRQ